MGLNVLVADDVQSMRDQLCRLLSGLGHNAESVPSGEAAVERAKAASYGMIFLDINMGGMSGLQAARMIREHDSDVPIYIVSPDKIEAARLARADATGWIEKGMRMAEHVLAVVGSYS